MAPESTCVPSNSPDNATFANEMVSVDFANSKANRQSCAAARPTLGEDSSGSSAGSVSRNLLWSLRCVIVVGSKASKMLSASVVSSPSESASTGRDDFRRLLESGKASDRSWTNASCELPICRMSPGCKGWSRVSGSPLTSVPFRLSRSRSCHWPWA